MGGSFRRGCYTPGPARFDPSSEAHTRADRDSSTRWHVGSVVRRAHSCSDDRRRSWHYGTRNHGAQGSAWKDAQEKTALNFYTPQQAMDYLQGKVAEVFNARARLQDLYGRAVIMRQKSMGTENAVRASQLVTDLTTTLQDQTELENRVRSIVPDSWVPQNMGIVPLIIGAGAIAIAGAVYLHLQRVAEHAQTLALVEKGVLTPAQALALEQSGGLLGSGGLSGITGNLSTLLMLAVGGYALFLFGPMVSRMVGGRKS
jgi:hypothetical protein